MSDTQNIGLVVTDGRSDDAEATWKSAMSLRNEDDAFMIAVGIGGNIRNLELEGIASEPLDANVIVVNNFNELLDIEDTLYQAVCNGEYCYLFP